MLDFHTLVSAVVGALVSASCFLFWKYFYAEKKALETADLNHQESASSNTARIGTVEKRIQHLEVSVHRDFVRREDWVPQMTILQAKLDALAKDLHTLVGRGKNQ